MLGNPKASKQVYNIAGDKYATFDGIAKACAAAAGAPPPELVHFNAKDFDFGKAKAFPMRDQHFFASVEKAKRELDWAPEFDMLSGLKDSYAKDFGCVRGRRVHTRDATADMPILTSVCV
jgi:nucleoside-diphosphate-sugar epimerase